MSKHLPLIVDLDGTLLVTDTLAEGFANAVLRKPLRTSGGLLTLLSGRAAFKRFIHETAEVDIHARPERADLLPPSAPKRRGAAASTSSRRRRSRSRTKYSNATGSCSTAPTGHRIA